MANYDKASDSFQRGRAITLQASTTKTATYNSTGVATDGGTLRLDLAVTAHAGTSPTLDVKVQTSPDNSTWSDVASFTQVTTTNGTSHKLFAPVDKYARLAVTVGGTTPSYTFSVTGDTL